MQFPARQNRHRIPLHLLSHQHREVEVRREKAASEEGVPLGRPISTRAKTSWQVAALNYLVTIGILPNVSFIGQIRDVHSAQSARFRTGRLRNKEKKVEEKCRSNFERCTTVELCIAGRRASGILSDFTEGYKSLGTNSTSTIHKNFAASGKHPRKKSIAD